MTKKYSVKDLLTAEVSEASKGLYEIETLREILKELFTYNGEDLLHLSIKAAKHTSHLYDDLNLIKVPELSYIDYEYPDPLPEPFADKFIGHDPDADILDVDYSALERSLMSRGLADFFDVDNSRSIIRTLLMFSRHRTRVYQLDEDVVCKRSFGNGKVKLKTVLTVKGYEGFADILHTNYCHLEVHDDAALRGLWLSKKLNDKEIFDNGKVMYGYGFDRILRDNIDFSASIEYLCEDGTTLTHENVDYIKRVYENIVQINGLDEVDGLKLVEVSNLSIKIIDMLSQENIKRDIYNFLKGITRFSFVPEEVNVALQTINKNKFKLAPIKMAVRGLVGLETKIYEIK